MLLTFLIFVPLIWIFVLSYISAHKVQLNNNLLNSSALGITIVDLIISLIIFILYDNSNKNHQFIQKQHNIGFYGLYLAINGLSIYFVLRTTYIKSISIISNWKSIFIYICIMFSFFIFLLDKRIELYRYLLNVTYITHTFQKINSLYLYFRIIFWNVLYIVKILTLGVNLIGLFSPYIFMESANLGDKDKGKTKEDDLAPDSSNSKPSENKDENDASKDKGKGKAKETDLAEKPVSKPSSDEDDWMEFGEPGSSESNLSSGIDKNISYNFHKGFDPTTKEFNEKLKTLGEASNNNTDKLEIIKNNMEKAEKKILELMDNKEKEPNKEKRIEMDGALLALENGLGSVRKLYYATKSKQELEAQSHRDQEAQSHRDQEEWRESSPSAIVLAKKNPKPDAEPDMNIEEWRESSPSGAVLIKKNPREGGSENYDLPFRKRLRSNDPQEESSKKKKSKSDKDDPDSGSDNLGPGPNSTNLGGNEQGEGNNSNFSRIAVQLCMSLLLTIEQICEILSNFYF